MGRGSTNMFKKSTRNTLHVVLDDYSPGDENILKRSHSENITERKISDLNQQSPKSDEWQDFLSNHNNKFQLTNLTLRVGGRYYIETSPLICKENQGFYMIPASAAKGLISDYLLEKTLFSKDLSITKGQFCFFKKTTCYHYLCRNIIFKPQRS